jgi:hypothetical protein
MCVPEECTSERIIQLSAGERSAGGGGDQPHQCAEACVASGDCPYDHCQDHAIYRQGEDGNLPLTGTVLRVRRAIRLDLRAFRRWLLEVAERACEGFQFCTDRIKLGQ